MEFIRHHRSYQSIVQKAFDIGLTCKTRWSEEEEQLLIDYYKTHTKISKVELSALIPAHPAVQCITKASYLGLSRSKFNWTDEKLELLRQLYPEQGAKCANSIGCSSTACAQMAHKLGVSFKKPEAKPKTERVKFAWTIEEDNLIRTTYPKSIDDCATKLSNRSRASIVARAKKLGVVYVGAERVVKCVELNIPYTLTEAAARFNRTKGALIHACKISGCCAGYHWEYVEDKEN